MTNEDSQNENQFEQHRYGPVEEAKSTPDALDWLPVTFGQHEGRSLPGIILNDLPYFYQMLENGSFRGELLEQARMVKCKAAFILSRRSHCNFILQTGRGRCCGWPTLKSISVKRGRLIDMVGPSRICLYRRLDLGIYRRFEDSYDAADKLMCFMRREFFSDATGELADKDCEQFFESNCNFMPFWQDLYRMAAAEENSHFSKKKLEAIIASFEQRSFMEKPN